MYFSSNYDSIDHKNL